MSRQDSNDNRLINPTFERGVKSAHVRISGNVTDNLAIPVNGPPVWFIGASAVRDILMPALSSTPNGTEFTFISTSSTTTGVLTFKTATDAALSPAVTIVQNAAVTLIKHPTAWRVKSRGV